VKTYQPERKSPFIRIEESIEDELSSNKRY